MPDPTPEPLKPTDPGGEMEHNDPRHADDLEKAGENQAADEQRSYDPSNVEATRTRMQGGGMGQRDLDRQRDPTRADSTEHYGQMQPEGGREGGDVEHGKGGHGSVE